MKKNLYSNSYGQWLSIQKAIREARSEAEISSGCYIPPQSTWIDKKELTVQFVCGVASLIRVHEIFYEAPDDEKRTKNRIMSQTKDPEKIDKPPSFCRNGWS